MAFKEYNGLNLSQVADEVLADWEKNRSFEKSISLRKNASKFIFYEGPSLCQWHAGDTSRYGTKYQRYFL